MKQYDSYESLIKALQASKFVMTPELKEKLDKDDNLLKPVIQDDPLLTWAFDCQEEEKIFVQTTQTDDQLKQHVEKLKEKLAPNVDLESLRL
eukprot:CAMPEP_0201550982 /NCGR_PEP_ID=MMETSP0173_2-20130828/7246_1 /ASSEMBLY_ACC=CAM_ASM_000268 /TAXON_ID=218659 /ORGANISM="Vexillifera sp., Strain DIVA3 564/2" /LENGTH=91 /DNA_ID=CAMNT_0047961119 /DNA_START=285 /DNA_END=560 /DNA_ORIENTATION=-